MFAFRLPMTQTVYIEPSAGHPPLPACLLFQLQCYNATLQPFHADTCSSLLRLLAYSFFFFFEDQMASDHGSPGHDHELHTVVRDDALPSTSVRLSSSEPECLSAVIAQGLQTMKTRFKASHQSQRHRYIRGRASRLSLFRRRSHFWRPRLHSWQKTKRKVKDTHLPVACMVARGIRG
jgi:hypothetical protein